MESQRVEKRWLTRTKLQLERWSLALLPSTASGSAAILLLRSWLLGRLPAAWVIDRLGNHGYVLTKLKCDPH